MATGETIVPYALDDLFASSGIGSLDRAIGLNLSVFNYRQTPSSVPRNKEQQGFVFFTRPQLNMQADNLRNFRIFYDLLTSNELSQERLIRCMLDPRLAAGYRYNGADAPIVTTPLCDQENAFIPFLSNNLNTITGWPEQVMTFSKSRPDVYNGVRTQPNGVARINGSYTLSASLRNTHADPIIKLIHYWVQYMSAVSTTGELRPYADMEAWDMIDSNTRIYRIVLDPTKSRVTKIFATGAALPASNAVSAAADFNKETPYSDQTKDLNITFECDGLIVMDPILIQQFNNTVGAFCPGMRDNNRDSSMVRLDKSVQHFFTTIPVYPRIDPNTFAFDWYARVEKYNARAAQVMSMLGDTNQALEIGD